MQTEFNLRQKRRAGHIINDTFTYFRLHFKPLMKSILTIAGPFIILGSIFFGFFYYQIFTLTAAQTTPSPFMAFYILLALVLLFIGMVLQHGVVAGYMNISLTTQKKDICLKDIRKHVKQRFFTYFFGIVLIYIIVFISMLFLFIPSIFFLVALSLFFFAVSVENKGIGSAISRSMSLINGHWWKSFGTYFLMNMIVSTIISLIYLPMMLLSGLNNAIIIGEGGAPDLTLIKFIASIGMPLILIISSLASTVLLVTLGINYFSIVEEKEEIGLKEQIESLETENA